MFLASGPEGHALTATASAPSGTGSHPFRVPARRRPGAEPTLSLAEGESSGGDSRRQRGPPRGPPDPTRQQRPTVRLLPGGRFDLTPVLDGAHIDGQRQRATTATPSPSGATPLYDPAFEHDACGVGFVADAGGRARLERVLPLALGGLAALAHRGAFGADGASSDGAGVSLPLDPSLVEALVPGPG